MNENTISNTSKYGAGYILVLFILLVIVVQTFCVSQARAVPVCSTDNGSVSAASSVSFYVVNNSTYTLILDTISGSTSPPTPRNLGPAPVTPSRYELTTYPPFGTNATARYYVSDPSVGVIGGFSFRMVNLALGNGHEIRNVESSGVIIAGAVGNTLYVNQRLPG
ncbi:hypothetical protein SAMN05444162_0749 [Paenibacillaceae bacterium GAS479]|nr:hypothetical protein SAMN05444162_0749 [Paenibacillaceae bacterium GAS479]